MLISMYKLLILVNMYTVLLANSDHISGNSMTSSRFNYWQSLFQIVWLMISWRQFKWLLNGWYFSYIVGFDEVLIHDKLYV